MLCVERGALGGGRYERPGILFHLANVNDPMEAGADSAVRPEGDGCGSEDEASNSCEEAVSAQRVLAPGEPSPAEMEQHDRTHLCTAVCARRA